MPWMSLLLKVLYHRINGSITPLPYDFRHLVGGTNTWPSNNSNPEINTFILLILPDTQRCLTGHMLLFYSFFKPNEANVDAES